MPENKADKNDMYIYITHTHTHKIGSRETWR